jgi:hypothetical protein
MKKTAIIIITVLAAIVGVFVGSKIAKTVFNDEASFDKQLMTISSELNKNCPFMVDKDTRLDNTFGGPGNLFTYNYSLINYTIDELNIGELQSFLKPRLINNMKMNKNMKSFSENSVTLIYRYSDKNGKFAFDIKIAPADYKNEQNNR